MATAPSSSSESWSRASLPTAFHFKVSFGSKPSEQDAAFTEVRGIGSEIETEQVPIGGEERFLILPKSVKHPRLVLKRGITSYDSDLLTWCRDTLESGLGKPIEPRAVQVFLLGGDAEVLHSWSLACAYPVKMDVEPFSSTKNAIALETIEMVYASVTRNR